MSVVAATKGFVFFRRENMSNVAKKDGASYWIRVAIWLILSFAGWLTPAVGPVTDYGMKILFIFVGLDLSGSDLSKFSFGGTGGNRQWGTGKHVLLCRVLQ